MGLPTQLLLENGKSVTQELSVQGCEVTLLKSLFNKGPGTTQDVNRECPADGATELDGIRTQNFPRPLDRGKPPEVEVCGGLHGTRSLLPRPRTPEEML